MNPANTFAPSEVAAVIHTLEVHIDRHGELMNALLINPEQLVQSWQEHQDTQLQQYEVPQLRLNLLDKKEIAATQIHQASFTLQAYRYWVEHLQRMAKIPCPPELETECMQKICEWIIFSAQQTGFVQKLEAKLQDYDRMRNPSITCASIELNEFVTWLGYKDIPPQLRPRSKLNPDMAIFSPLPRNQRQLPLTRLGEKSSYRNLVYIGDWLVALHARGLEYTSMKLPEE